MSSSSQQPGYVDVKRRSLVTSAGAFGAIAASLTAFVPQTAIASTSITDFGAVGNDSTDNTTAIQNAINATPAGGLLFIPRGIFRVNGTLSRVQTTPGVNKSIHIRGEGSSSVIKQMSTTATTLLLDATVDQMSGWGLEDFVIAQVAGASSGDAINLRHMHRGLLKNVYVAGCAGSALLLEHCIINTFVNFCTSTAFDVGFSTTRPRYGIRIQNSPTVSANYSSMNTFIGGCAEHITTGPGIGVYMLNNGHANRLYGFTSESNDVGVQINADVSDYVLDGIWLESNGTDYIINNPNGIFRPALNIAPHRARVHHGSNQSIAHSTSTVLAFNGEDYDVGDLHDTSSSNSRFTVKMKGLYKLWAIVNWSPGSTGYRMAVLLKNGNTAVAIVQQNAPVADELVQNVQTEVQLNAGDYVEVAVFHTQGSSINVLGSTDRTQFGIRYVAEYL